MGRAVEGVLALASGRGNAPVSLGWKRDKRRGRMESGKVIGGCAQSICQILGRMWPGWGWLHSLSINSVLQGLKPTAAVGKGA